MSSQSKGCCFMNVSRILQARISVKRLFRVVVALALYRTVLHALQPLAHKVQHSGAACLL